MDHENIFHLFKGNRGFCVTVFQDEPPKKFLNGENTKESSDDQEDKNELQALKNTIHNFYLDLLVSRDSHTNILHHFIETFSPILEEYDNENPEEGNDAF